MRFVVLKHSDGRTAIKVDAIKSIQEVTEEDGNDYVALITKWSTFYFTNYAHKRIVDALEKEARLYRNSMGGSFLYENLFFTFAYKGKQLSFKLDDVLYIQETDIENEYFLTLRLSDGVEYDIEDTRFDDLLNAASRFTGHIEPDKDEGK